MVDEFISLQEIARVVHEQNGKLLSTSHIVRDTKKNFPDLELVKSRTGVNGYPSWSVPIAYKDRLVKYFLDGTGSENPLRSKKQKGWEQKCAEELTAQGYVTFVMKEPGIPDIFGFRKRENGGFDLIFREVKGPGDGLRRAQHEVI